MGFFKVIETPNKAKQQESSEKEAQAQTELFEKLKNNFKGFDKNGNAIVDDNGERVSFSAKDFPTLVNRFIDANPNAKDGSYEDWFNEDQFKNIESQGNKFQGFDDKGNLIYRNEKGDLEDFGKQGGFADFAKKQMADKKFSMANQGVANRVQDENKQLDPFSQRQGLSTVINANKAANTISNPQNVSSDSQQTQTPAGGGFGKFESQITKQAQEQNKAIAQQKAKSQQQQAPSLTGMAANFAKQQAEKEAKQQAAPVISQADAQARQAAQPYVQQGQAVKNQVGQQVQQATGFNPYTSIQNQAVNKAAEMTGVDSGLLNQGLGAITNPQQAIANLAKQQVANNVSGLISNTTGADAGMAGNLVNSLVSGGNVGNALTNMATDKAKDMALNYAKEQLADTAVGNLTSQIPGGIGAALQGLKAAKTIFSGKGTSEQKGAAAAQAAARAALAASTGGLSELAGPETTGAAAQGLTNIKDSKTLNRMGVAGDAVKGLAGVGAGSLNTVKDAANIGLGAVGNTGATTARTFKGAGEGLKKITQGNIGEGLKGLGSTAIKAALDTFIKNPVNLAKNLGGAAAKTVGKVLNAINIFCFDGDTKILMADRSYKMIKDISVDDVVFLGGKVTAIGTAKVQGLYDYNGIKVSSDHAVFERGVWKRIKNTVDGKKLHDEEVEVYPISTEHHLVITEGGQIFADMDEVDDTYNKTDDQIIKELNKDVKRNRVLNVFHKTFLGKI